MTFSEKYFDQVPDRHGTWSCKWDELDLKQDPEGKRQLIHLGVADMDFPVAPCITQHFQKIIDHGVYGYSMLSTEFASAIVEWNLKQYGIEIDPEWIVFVPRITTSAHMCVRLFTDQTASCLGHIPLYSPLQEAVTLNDRELLGSPLIQDKTQSWRIDFADMEQRIKDNTQFLLLCDPHNPTGRCFTKQELSQLAEFALKHKLTVFVDEIHADLLRQGFKHNSLLNYSEELNENIIIASSLTKTFNLPGVILSWLIVPSQTKREQIQLEIKKMGMNNPTSFASAVVPVAYRESEARAWLEAVCNYIDQNENFVRQYLNEHLPELNISPREGTYLLWLDYRAYAVKHAITKTALERWLLDEAGVEVYLGESFGPSGAGFIRVNLATSRKLLQKALEAVIEALPKLDNYF